jgi:hypothetical protein
VRIISLKLALSVALLAGLLLLAVRASAGGWYLMGPPTEADVDGSCQEDGWPRWRDLRAAGRYRESISDARSLRCWRESLIEAPGAAVSTWVRIETPKAGAIAGEYFSAFEKLEDCETAAYVAHHSGSTRRGAGTRFVRPKSLTRSPRT